ncbi:MAG: type 4a pilus biogenesis protein PilO [Candidatus Cloacimonetes bacterium]|nr:type 4a pilus biogenesis protein PilO [Candidatus Cloacimonadota bacterium]
MIVKVVSYVFGMVLISIVTAGVWILEYKQPLDEQIQAVDTEMRKLKSQRSKGKKLKRSLKKIEKQIKDVRAEIVTFLKEKGKGRDVGKFLNDVENDAQDSGIELKTIRINPRLTRSKFIEIPLEFSISGTYFQLYDFFTRVESRKILNFADSGLRLGGGGGRGYKLPRLSKLITKKVTLKDLAGKKIPSPAYSGSTTFPKMRAQFEGKIIMVDRGKITQYEN